MSIGIRRNFTQRDARRFATRAAAILMDTSELMDRFSLAAGIPGPGSDNPGDDEIDTHLLQIEAIYARFVAVVSDSGILETAFLAAVDQRDSIN